MQDNNNPMNGQPEGQNPYSMNQGFGTDQPGDVTQPFQAADANQGYGVNQPGVNQGYNMDAGGDMNMNQGYGMNQPGMNQGYNMGAGGDMNQGYNMGAGSDMNQGYNMGAGSDMNQGYNMGAGQPNMNQGYNMGTGQPNMNQGYNMGAGQPNMNQGYNMGAGGDMNQGYNMNQPGGGYQNPAYGYGAGGPGYQQQQKQNKKKLGAIVAAIAVILVAIIGIIIGVVLNKDDEPEDGPGTFATGPTAAPREEVTPEPTEEPTPEPDPEPTDEPEPTEEPEELDVPEIDPNLAVQGSVTDSRASFTGYYGENYILIKNNQWDDYNLVYADTQEAYALVDTDVRYFTVIDGDVYYTSRDADTGTYSFWKIAIRNGAEPELLLDGTQVCAFSYYEGLIYYDNYDDYYELYCYDPVTGSNEKVDYDSLGYYYILDGYVYYERMDDKTMCKMRLDGTDKQTLFALSDYGLENLSCLTAFNVGGYVFFAFNTPAGELLLTTEDGGAYELIAEDLMDFDLNQDIYYADGSIYYSAQNGTEVHKLDIAEYLNDADMETIPDSIICDDSFYYFEVTDGLIYVELYGGNNEVEVMDYQTGEIYNTFDFS
ncbi:MAG: DUF5050 domain-containing protein [Clostridium sp.]|nr:DUF5050 domain-containing protein [Clostridium sp.]